jgi:hypothetical protein
MTELKPIAEYLPSEPVKRRRRGGLSPDDAVLTEREELVLDLVEVGIALRKAEHLTDNYPESQIRRQLDWLPQRNARRPAPLLIAAIEHNYDAPAYATD